MNNLYTLTAQQQAMAHRLELAGFDDATISDTLEGDDNTDALREKRLGYVAIIKQKRAMAEARQAAANSIFALIERDFDTADRMEAALMKSMNDTGDRHLVGLEFEAHIRGKTKKVLIKDESLVPAAYMRIPAFNVPAPVPDKAAIKAALIKGELVDGCTLGTDKKLVIL